MIKGLIHGNGQRVHLRGLIIPLFLLLLLVSAALAPGAGVLNAEGLSGGERVLLRSSDISEWEGMVKLNTEVKRSEPGSFELYGSYPTELISSRMFPVDMNYIYKLSIWFRTLDAEIPASGYLGMRMYDRNKRPINVKNVHAYPRTESVLVSEAVEGAEELVVAANHEWLGLTGLRIAFYAGEDYADLPNYDLSPGIEKVIDEGSKYRVILSKPMKDAYPAGTSVRLHSPWGVPLYNLVQGWMPAEWTHFTRVLEGEAHHGIPRSMFWPGTKYVRIFVWFGNWQRIPEDGAILLADDIKFSKTRTLARDFEWGSWKFAEDPDAIGMSEGWYSASHDDSGWNDIEVPAVWADTWAGDYLGYGWYRTCFEIPEEHENKAMLLRFRGVDEQGWVFVNGNPVGEHTVASENRGVGDLWDAPFEVRVDAGLLKSGARNQLTVLVHASAHNGGIWRSVLAGFPDD